MNAKRYLYRILGNSNTYNMAQTIGAAKRIARGYSAKTADVVFEVVKIENEHRVAAYRNNEELFLP